VRSPKPVARATAVIPPCPNSSASLAAQQRHPLSSNSAFMQGNRIKNRNYLKIFVFKNLRFIL
jgi:hypothetical protein